MDLTPGNMLVDTQGNVHVIDENKQIIFFKQLKKSFPPSISNHAGTPYWTTHNGSQVTFSSPPATTYTWEDRGYTYLSKSQAEFIRILLAAQAEKEGFNVVAETFMDDYELAELMEKFGLQSKDDRDNSKTSN